MKVGWYLKFVAWGMPVIGLISSLILLSLGGYLFYKFAGKRRFQIALVAVIATIIIAALMLWKNSN